MEDNQPKDGQRSFRESESSRKKKKNTWVLFISKIKGREQGKVERLDRTSWHLWSNCITDKNYGKEKCMTLCSNNYSYLCYTAFDEPPFLRNSLLARWLTCPTGVLGLFFSPRPQEFISLSPHRALINTTAITSLPLWRRNLKILFKQIRNQRPQTFGISYLHPRQDQRYCQL